MSAKFSDLQQIDAAAETHGWQDTSTARGLGVRRYAKGAREVYVEADRNGRIHLARVEGWVLETQRRQQVLAALAE